MEKEDFYNKFINGDFCVECKEFKKGSPIKVRHPIDANGKLNTKVTYCYSCGQTVKNQKYCHNCGQKLNWNISR